MKDDKYRYKLHLRDQKKSHLNGITDSLYTNLINKNSGAFWKSFNNKLGEKKKIEQVVDGHTSEKDIANSFAACFAKICSPNSADHFINAHNSFKQKMNDYRIDLSIEDTLFSLELVENTIANLKKGKAASLDKLTAEHILYAHPCVVLIITKILNLMLIYEYVPDAFGQTITVPIPKEAKAKGNASSEDYRGITISPIISKIFEHCLLHRYKKYLASSNFQFGF